MILLVICLTFILLYLKLTNKQCPTTKNSKIIKDLEGISKKISKNNEELIKILNSYLKEAK